MDFTEPTTWAGLYYATEWVIRLVMLVVVPFRRSPEAAKGWLLLVFFLPWLGLILYFLIGRPTFPRWRREQLDRLPGAMAGILERLRRDPHIQHPPLVGALSQAATLAANLGHLRPLAGNAAELLPGYRSALDRLVADVDSAKDHVHLLYYIFADDETGRRIVEALARAVKRGVRCRVLIDALGSRRWARSILKRLVNAGVEAHSMLPLGFLRWKKARLDLRNHRKIAVIDGRIGFTGSQNLVDAAFKKDITYEEMVVRVTGPIVLQLQMVFVADWFLTNNEILESDAIYPDPDITGPVVAQALASGPDFSTQNVQRFIVALIHGARERVVVVTPYFIPDVAFLQALQTAVLRGVEVHLVVSQIADQVLVSLAQKSYYEELLEAGIQIHLYGEKFLHAKHLSVDGEIALIGSSNMDIRSFVLNSEISLVFYDREVAARLRENEERYFRGSQLLNREEWQQRSLPAQVAQNLARLMSPLL